MLAMKDLMHFLKRYLPIVQQICVEQNAII
jgi:hypothetical protein